MSEAENLFAVLRQSAEPEAADAIEKLVQDAPDRALCRINVLDFAARTGLDEERVIAAFLHAARLGIFELSWNVLCPGCGGVLDTSTTLKSVDKDEYACAWCAAGYTPTLDEIVEVTFTVSRRVRRIAAHDPDELPFNEYFRQVFWGSGIDVPDNFEDPAPGNRPRVGRAAAGRQSVAVAATAGGVRDRHRPGDAWHPVPRRQGRADARAPEPDDRFRQAAPADRTPSSCGPAVASVAGQPYRDTRVLPGLWVANDKLHELLGRRKPFLTAKRLLTNQVFRDLYGTNTIDAEQRLKITSLTFLFTDLKGSTELYERVGDLVAFDLVRAHFKVLNEIVAAEAGAVVKTIGDAVMATFSTPDRAVAAALRMREAMRHLGNGGNGHNGHNGEDLLLKIGIHEGPCLAVVLNDRQDYFGQTVNIAARVQALANSRSILATGSVVAYPQTSNLLKTRGLDPVAQSRALRGIADEVAVYEIP